MQSGKHERLAELANRAKLPTLASVRPCVDAGALASYVPKVLPQYRLAAMYVDKVRKDAKPVDLPVAQPTTFERVINPRTAKALGLTI